MAGRYPFDVGSDRYWAGVKAGFHYDDLMIFEGCVDQGCTISYNPVTIPGGVVAAEMGAELGSLHFIAGYGMGLAGFSRPYSNMVDVDVGAEIVDHVFIDLGFSWVDRNVILEGAESGLERGTLNDEQLVFKLGAGFAL